MNIGVYIPLTKGKFALVDREIYDRVIQYKWYYDESKGYAARNISRHEGRSTTKEYLHQFVVFTKVTEYSGLVDHKNRQKLDCRIDNLRFGTDTNNHANMEKQFGTYSSKYKGVCTSTLTSDFREITTAQIYYKGRRIYLGSYSTQKEAADAYDNAAIVFFGEFANLNCSWLEER